MSNEIVRLMAETKEDLDAIVAKTEKKLADVRAARANNPSRKVLSAAIRWDDHVDSLNRTLDIVKNARLGLATILHFENEREKREQGADDA